MFELRNRTNHTKPWHAEDIDQMAELLRSGSTIRDVSAHLGRTQEAVRNKARLLDMLPKQSKRSKFLIRE
jgi:hypothetical protein